MGKKWWILIILGIIIVSLLILSIGFFIYVNNSKPSTGEFCLIDYQCCNKAISNIKKINPDTDYRYVYIDARGKCDNFKCIGCQINSI